MSTNADLISFACEGCGRPFSVPATFAGRKATCKTCGAKVVVPAHAASVSAAPRAPEPQPTNGNGKSHHGGDFGHGSRAVITRPTFSEVDVPTGDPTTPRPRVSHVAVISEGQSAPAATAPTLLDESQADRSARHELLDDVVEELAAPVRKSPKIPMRVRRLMVDAEQVSKAFAGDGPIQIKSAVGDPPELYQVEYKVAGLQRGWLGKPRKRDMHLVEIQLTSEYPRVSPKCRMLTPVFHPNIDETTICVGDHWTAGERLVDLIIRIGQMLAYQDYNIKSPLNGEAAMWADLNPKKLPVDSRNLQLADAI